MSLTIQPSHAYFLLGGLYLGKLTNLASDIIITGLVLYIVTPHIFTDDRIERVKNWCWSWFERKPTTIDLSRIDLSQIDLTKLDLSQLSDEQKIKLKLLEPSPTTKNFFDFSSLPKIEILNSVKAK